MTTAPTSGSASSSCQTSTGSAPSARSAHAASRSSFEPGKTTTAMRGPELLLTGRRQLDLVRLDQRVREELVAHPFDLDPRLPLVGRLHLEIDDPPDPRSAHSEPELPERRLHRLALRIEDARLRPDEDRGPHRSTASGSARYSSNGSPVSCSNASTYRARVPATTSGGSSGPGEVLSQASRSQ